MSNQPPITIYSTTWCGYCRTAKQYFESKKLAYKEVDVEQDQMAAMYIVNKTHQAGVPVIEIGDEVIIGFNRPMIDAALAK